MKSPPRLLDDPNVAPELRADLERSAKSEYRYDVAAGLATLQTVIGSAGGSLFPPAADAANAGSQTAQAGTAAAGAKGSVLAASGLKAALAAVGTAAVVAVGVATLPAGGPPKSKLPVVAAPAAPVAAAPAPVAQPVPEPAAPLAQPEPLLAAEPTTPTGVRSPARTPDADRALRREIALVGQMKAALENDPLRTYELSQQANREFGRGMLYEEREALAALALSNLGREQQAALRARAFLARYPKSPLRERLEQVAQGH